MAPARVCGNTLLVGQSHSEPEPSSGLAARSELSVRLERAPGRAELLYEMAEAVIRAERVEQVFEAALDAIGRALGTVSSSILAFDAGGVMRFKAWRGISEIYRAAVEGHTPWPREVRNPAPIVVEDVTADASLAPLSAVFERESIRALAFFPLVTGERLIGKFMVYYPAPRPLSAAEIEIGQAIANHVAAAIARFSAVAELRETVRFNEIFTGMLGHDLRNPLGAIMTAAQVALRRGGDEKIAKPLSRILSSGDRMARMIDQLLDFTRVRVGAGIPIEPRRVDLVAMLRQVIDELEATNPECAVTLDVASTETHGAWDPDRLTQVFSNVVANAVRHGVAQSGVRVRVSDAEGLGVRVEVHNMGAIPQDLVPKLFEPMAGGDRRRDKSQGLGLGLYISQEILRAHGGRIDVRSSDSQGTTLTILLPRTPEAS